MDRWGETEPVAADSFDEPLETELVHAVLIASTGRGSPSDAVAWIAEGHPLAIDTDRQELARVVASLDGSSATAALERLTREITASELDPAAVLHQADLLPKAVVFRNALDVLAGAADGSLENVSATALRIAQHRDSHVMETLEALIGVTHKELRQRVAGLPMEAHGTWTNTALNDAFAYIDALVSGTLSSVVGPGAFLPVPVELMPRITGSEPNGGWASLECFRAEGVPYELMLAQRVVGSAWGQHRNRTSQSPLASVAAEVRDRLVEAGMDVVLSDKYGGTARQTDLNALVGGDQHVNLVVRTAVTTATPLAVVTFSLAKDGGSARKTLAAKLQMDAPRVPVFVVALGAGFSQRNESVQLVRHFRGAVYTEQTIAALVAAISRLSPST